MLRLLGENLALKVIALATSVMIWLYVSAERDPMVTRQVMAEPKFVGTPPADLIVRPRADPVLVEVTGPRGEVQSIQEGEVKALVNLRQARANVPQLPIIDYQRPPGAPNVTFRGLRQYVAADVDSKVSKSLPISHSFNNDAPFGRTYGPVKLEPSSALVLGAREDVARVRRLVVFIETRGGNVREDLPIRALDADGVLVENVEIQPVRTHVELNLVEAPATRTLIVNVPLQGRPAFPYEVAEVLPQPDQVTVVGPFGQIQQLSSVSTSPVSVEGITQVLERDVSLRLPEGVSTADGRTRVRVRVRVREIARQPAPPPAANGQ